MKPVLNVDMGCLDAAAAARSSGHILPEKEATMRPTELADLAFTAAHSNNIANAKGMPEGFQQTLSYMLQGLGAMNTGLRATYIKLEEIERLIKARR